MADNNDHSLDELTALVTPAATDELYVVQGGADFRSTRAQVHALESGEHLVLPQVDEVGTPTLAFGDGDTGLYESADDTLNVSIAGVTNFRWAGTLFRSEDKSNGRN